MAKRDYGVAKWHQKQFENSNENNFMSQRASTREAKQRHKNIRALISDKIWFDSLSFDEKESVVHRWYMYPKVNEWVSWSFGSTVTKNNLKSVLDSDDIQEKESREEYCKRFVPGDLNLQRDMKLNKILS